MGESSPIEFQSELHGPGISLNVCDSSELATNLADHICLAIGTGRQAVDCVRKSQILVVESIKDFPAKLEIFALLQMEVFSQSRIQVPEARRTNSRQIETCCPKAPGTLVGGVIVSIWVASKRGFESSRIDPLSDALFLRARAAKPWIAD